MITPITNVKYTPNNRISFGQGVQTNRGLSVPSANSNIVEGGLVPGFFGTIFPSRQNAQERANSIESGLIKTKINFFA